MGLLDSFFGNADKMEKKGDSALESGKPLDAMREFQSAIRKAGERDPLAKERLEAKVRRARVSFHRLKVEEAAELLQDDLLDEAGESLQIAREHESGVPPTDISRRTKLEGQLRNRLEELGGPDIALPNPDGADVQVTGVREVVAEDRMPPSQLDASFDQLSSALAPEDREHAATLGRAFKQGFVAQQTGQPEVSLKALQQAIEDHPDDGLVIETLAVALDQSGDEQQAATYYQRALDADPKRRNARIALAAMRSGVETTHGLQAANRLLQAIHEFKGARARDTYEAAMKLLEEGAREDPPGAGQYLIAAAEISLIYRQPQAALAQLEQVAKMGNDKLPSLWHLMALSSEMGGDLDRAEDSYDKAVRLGGNAMFFRAEFAEFALRHERALETAEKTIFDTCIGCQAAQVSPEELDYYGFLLSRIQYARGEYKDALEGVDRLLRKGIPPVMEPVLNDLRDRILAAQKEVEPPERDRS